MITNRAEQTDIDALLGQIASEFFDAVACGENPEVEDYARRYPEVADHVRELFPPLELMKGSASGTRVVSNEMHSSGPQQLGDYQIVQEIGRGGMGVVYEAQQLSLGRTVALKVLPFAAVMDQKAITRFKNEARAAATLEHPHIVPVHAVGNERGVYYYAMSLIHGMTLAEVIRQLRQRVTGSALGDAGSLSIDDILSSHSVASTANAASGSSCLEETRDCELPSDQAAQQATLAAKELTQREVQAAISTRRSLFTQDYFRNAARLGEQAAEALEHAHQHGIVHRDIKPGNLMIDWQSKLWVTDFGLARMESDPGMTMTGDLIGTLRYMAPEQALANRVVVDHRADIYALGVTLYELLMLRPVYDGADRERLLRQITFDDPKPLRQLNRSVPTDLETIVLKAISKNPDDRYASALELGDDLRAFQANEPIKAKPPTIAQRSSRLVQRHKPLVASAAIILLLSTCGLAISNTLIAQQRNAARTAQANEQQQREEADHQRDEAERQRNEAQRQREIAEQERAEAERQKRVAQENFQRAREAVDTYLTKVSEDTLLDAPSLHPLRKDLLELALDYYLQFIHQQPDDAAVQAELAAAYARVGDITAEIGSAQEALTARQKAHTIRKTLAATYPTNFAYQQGLVDSRIALGQSHAAIGQIDAALVLYRDAISILEWLVQQNPLIEEHKSSLARACHNMASVCVEVRDYEEASALCRKGIKLQEELLDTNQGAKDHRSLLSILYHLLSLSHKGLDQTEEAMGSCRKAIEIEEILVRANPNVGKYQRSLSIAYNTLALLHMKLDQREEAIELHRKAIGLKEKLTDQNPDVLDYQFGLAISYHNLTLALPNESQSQERLQYLQKAEAILDGLLQRNPEVVRNQSLLSALHLNRSGVLERAGQIEEAIAQFEQAIRMQEQLLKQNPDVLYYQSDLSASYVRLATWYYCSRQFEEAKTSYKKAIAIREKLVEQNPNDRRMQRELARTYGRVARTTALIGSAEDALEPQQKAVKHHERCGSKFDLAVSKNRLASLYSSIGQIDKALALSQEALAINRKLLEEKNPDERRYQNNFASSCAKVGTLLLELGQTDEALRHFQKGLAVFETLVERHPNDLGYQLNFAITSNKLGEFFRKLGQVNEARRNYQTGVATLETLVDKKPDVSVFRKGLAELLIGLGTLQRDTGNEKAAVATFVKATHLVDRLNARQDIPHLWDEVGRAQFYRGNWQEARDALEEGIEQRGEEEPTLRGGPRWWYLTMTLHRLGEVEKARAYYDKLEAEFVKQPVAGQGSVGAEAAEVLGIELPAKKTEQTPDANEQPPGEAKSRAPN